MMHFTSHDSFKAFLTSHLIVLHQCPEVDYISSTVPSDLNAGLGILPGGSIVAIQFVTYPSETKKTFSNCD